jgi:predicted  nucleic acid-binding Zn-ribbon protein
LQSVQLEKKAIEEEFASMNDRISRYQTLQEKISREVKVAKSNERTKEEEIIYTQLKSTLTDIMKTIKTKVNQVCVNLINRK